VCVCVCVCVCVVARARARCFLVNKDYQKIVFDCTTISYKTTPFSMT